MDALCTTDERTAPTRDLGYVVKQHHNFHTKGMARANYLITTSQFQSWLTGRDSNILLVDGHCGAEESEFDFMRCCRHGNGEVFSTHACRSNNLARAWRFPSFRVY